MAVRLAAGLRHSWSAAASRGAWPWAAAAAAAGATSAMAMGSGLSSDAKAQQNSILSAIIDINSRVEKLEAFVLKGQKGTLVSVGEALSALAVTLSLTLHCSHKLLQL